MVPTAETPSPRIPVTGIITTYNEEHNVGACIESLAWCDEILVVDSFSTDRTCEIARSHPKVRLEQRTYYGSASQKNWAMDQATHEWVMILDADERCTPELKDEILALLASGPRFRAYGIRRVSFFLGKRVRYSGWQRDWVVRLLERGAGRCPDVRVAGGVVAHVERGSLKSPMEHYTIKDLPSFAARIEKYAYWGAAQAWKEGRSAGFAQIVARPVWRFLRTYVIQLGILDGFRGLVICALQAHGSFLKWAILWSWRTEARQGLQPDLPEFDEDPSVWGREPADGADRAADAEPD